LSSDAAVQGQVVAVQEQVAAVQGQLAAVQRPAPAVHDLLLHCICDKVEYATTQMREAKGDSDINIYETKAGRVTLDLSVVPKLSTSAPHQTHSPISSLLWVSLTFVSIVWTLVSLQN
jgi:hypothetical protein